MFVKFGCAEIERMLAICLLLSWWLRIHAVFTRTCENWFVDMSDPTPICCEVLIFANQCLLLLWVEFLRLNILRLMFSDAVDGAKFHVCGHRLN